MLSDEFNIIFVNKKKKKQKKKKKYYEGILNLHVRAIKSTWLLLQVYFLGPLDTLKKKQIASN